MKSNALRPRMWFLECILFNIYKNDMRLLDFVCLYIGARATTEYFSQTSTTADANVLLVTLPSWLSCLTSCVGSACHGYTKK